MFATKTDKDIAIASAVMLMKEAEATLASRKVDLLVEEKHLQEVKSPKSVGIHYAKAVVNQIEIVKTIQKRIDTDQTYLKDLKLIFEEASVMPVKED